MFNEMKMTEHKIMLEMNWLQQHNSRIDWKWKKVTMKNCKCKIRQTQTESWTEIKKQILEQYWKYEKLFMKLSENQILLKYKLWNHEISFKEEIMSEKLSIYQLLSEKLQELWDYLDNNLQRKYIWHFINKTEYSIIFVLKKNDKKWLYINYWKLNTMTWKNRYSLSLIKELQKRLKKVK